MSQDYFILFRDTANPAPTDIEYKTRSEQEDVLLSDKALYVWGYAGTFSDEQAEIVKQRYKAYVDERLRLESGFLATNLGDAPEIGFQSRTYKMTVVPRKPASRDFLAQVSPNLGFLPYVPLNRKVRIYPDSTAEKWRIVNALKSRSVQEQHGFDFHFWINKKQEDFEPHKRHRSFVMLLSLETLTDIWQRFGYLSHMDLLRRTAGIWVLETLEKNREVHTKKNHYHPEKIKTIFESLVLDDKKYISALTLRQLVVLGKCVDIANSIRAADGCEAENIENIYRALLEKNSQAEQAERAARKAEREAKLAEYKAKKDECEAMGVKYEAMRAEYEAMAAECEAMKLRCKPKRETNVDNDSSSPSLMQAASGKGNPISAVDAYQASIEWANDPAEVVIKNEESITVSIDENSIDRLAEKITKDRKKDTADGVRDGLSKMKKPVEMFVKNTEPIVVMESTDSPGIVATKEQTELLEKIVSSIDDGSIDDAVFRGLLQNRYADKVDRWDYISKTKYGGKGWMDLARADLELRKDKDGKPKPFTDQEATSYSHVIRRAVEDRREKRSQGKKQNELTPVYQTTSS